MWTYTQESTHKNISLYLLIFNHNYCKSIGVLKDMNLFSSAHKFQSARCLKNMHETKTDQYIDIKLAGRDKQG